jgi:hypothetical protein
MRRSNTQQLNQFFLTPALCAIMLFTGAVVFTGCEEDNAFEDMGDEIEDAADDAGDALEDAADDIEDEFD